MTRPEKRPTSGFLATRLRRLRYHPAVRALVRETRLSPANLVLPLFVRPGRGVRQPIASMPGHFQLSPDLLADEVSRGSRLGAGRRDSVRHSRRRRTPRAATPRATGGIVRRRSRRAKQAAPDVLVITDVCFCEYTDHGHCGVINQRDRPDGRRQRRHAGIVGQAGREPRPGRGRRGRPQRHDGRHGRGDSPAPGRQPASRTCRS